MLIRSQSAVHRGTRQEHTLPSSQRGVAVGWMGGNAGVAGSKCSGDWEVVQGWLEGSAGVAGRQCRGVATA